MNIKSLLLGSAAAMVAVSSAQAADAVVVEPEPVEYVRVCDAYGSGFFFIPGTETCIRFAGYVRSVYRHNETEVNGITVDATEDWVNRARMSVDTRNETDWGTLRGLFRLDTDIRGSGSDAATLDRAVVSLGGFRVGQTANYWTTNHGFAGIDLSGINGEDGNYFGATTAATVFDYTWAADGFAVTAGVQYTSAGGGDIRDRTLGAAAIPALGLLPDGTIDVGTPAVPATGNLYDYYIGFNWSADFGTIAGTYIVDGNGGAAGVNDDGDAWKISATLDLSEFVPGGTLHAMYMTDDGDLVEHIVGDDVWSIGADFNLTDELVLAGNYYSHEFDSGRDIDMFGAGLSWRPAAAPGLKLYVSYTSVEDTSAAGVETDSDGYAIEIRRSF
ncbi:MAG: porin [Rhizobiaceae bacterium]|nr:porin [Rhizobiaceae bacterium]